MDKPCKIQFVDKKIQKSYQQIDTKESLRKQIDSALCEIEKNPFCGIQIPKKQIPKEYKNNNNLWKYNLPGAWRLLYSIQGGKAVVVVIILDWVNHKTYEKKFKY
ncbi:hypothetical protein K8R30_04310 [archaeon]|nr:hypothetical protein [archaeon]